MPGDGDQLSTGERGLRLALAGLATWRVTHLLAFEDGPADVIVALRLRAGRSLLGELMDCFDCTSVWVAAALVPFAARRPGDRAVTWGALSGIACVLQRLVGAEDSGDQDVGLIIDLEEE